MLTSRKLATGICMLAATAALPAHAGLGDALSQLGAGLKNTGAQLSQGLSDSLGRLGDGLDTLGGSLSQSLGELTLSLQRLSGNYINPTDGTVISYDTVEHQGVARELVVIAPATASPEKAPVVVLLHYAHGDAEVMANMARAGRLAAEYGAYVVLPQAQGLSKRWGENPREYPSTGDVDFLVKVIAHMADAYPTDSQRVYMAGMSSGGFMTIRFTCEHSELLAAIAVDATFRNTQDRICTPSRAVPVVTFAGTRDPVVPYSNPLGMLSAQEAFARWSGINGCDPASRQDSSLPNTVDDGTSIEMSENWDCSSGGAVRLYTIVNGGHAWPGSDLRSTNLLGRSTQNLDATEAMWAFMSLFTL